jgi:hypothetical protein
MLTRIMRRGLGGVDGEEEFGNGAEERDAGMSFVFASEDS